MIKKIILLSVFLASTAICQAKTWYFSQVGTDGAGDGSLATPFICKSETVTTARLLAVRRNPVFTEAHVLHFGPGIYLTDATGITLVDEWGTGVWASVSIIGDPIYPPTIKFKSDAFGTPDPNTYRSVIWGKYRQKDVTVRNVILDCNFLGQSVGSGSSHTSGFRLGGINIWAERALIENVTVINAGANGAVPLQGAGTEVFPIWVRTSSRDQTPMPGRSYLLEIINCHVKDFEAENNGYCTAIMPVTRSTEQGTVFTTYVGPGPLGLNEQRLFGLNQAMTARVTGCTVDLDHKGFGLGTAEAEGIQFDNNTIRNTVLGFNCDTSPATNVVIMENRFIGTRMGINFGSIGQYKNGKIIGNQIILDGFPEYLCDVNPQIGTSFGIRLVTTSGFLIQENSITSVSASSFYRPSYSSATKQYTPLQIPNGSFQIDPCTTWNVSNTGFVESRNAVANGTSTSAITVL